MRFRYSRWDGTQDPFGPDIAAADVLEQLSDEILMGGSADAALQRLLRRGMQGRFSGLDALKRRLRQRREEEQEMLNLAGPLEQIRERLDEILERERTELTFRDDDDARMRESFLDALPPDAPGQVAELKEYRFSDPSAQQMFDALMQELREQVMGAHFRQMAEGMQSLTPEDIARFKDMLAELNGLIELRDRGEDTQPAFEDFMSRHGDLFPDNPRTLDELLEHMAKRMAAMSRFMASLTPEQREELMGLSQQIMQDMDLAFEMDRLGSNLANAFPDMPWGEPVMGEGEGSMPMSAAVDVMERLHDYEDLDRSMQGDYAGAALDDVDEDALRRTLGDPAVQDLRRLKQIERALEKAGLVQRRRGRLEVTPRGARRLGRRRLTQIFDELKRDREGTHEARDAGGLAEPTGATRPWNFGDHGQIAVGKTVFNAVVRSEPGPARSPATRRLRDRGGRAAHRSRHRAPAGPVVLDAAARPLHPRQEDGAGAARADRGPVSARHPVPDRVQRLRAPAAARGPRRRRGSSASTARTCNTPSCWPTACCRNIRGRRAR